MSLYDKRAKSLKDKILGTVVSKEGEVVETPKKKEIKKAKKK